MSMNKHYKEKDYIEDLISKRKLNSSIKGDLKALAKYYRSQGQTYNQVEESLYAFCKSKCKSWFNPVLHYKMIDGAVNFSRKKENVLIQIESISVTKSEMDYITSLPYSDLDKKILFTFIVIDKLKHEKARLRGSESNDMHYFGGSGEYSYKTLMDTLQEKLTRTYREKEIHRTIKRFNDDGLTRTTQKTALELLFLNEMELSDDTVLEVADFDSIGLYYDYFKGDKSIQMCNECRSQLIKKNIHNQSYCNECKHELKKRKDREYQYIKYNSRKASEAQTLWESKVQSTDDKS